MVPGDADGFLGVNVADALFLIKYIFLGGSAPVCIAHADVNSDDQITVGDVVYIVRYIFVMGAPAPVCGSI